MLRGGHGRLHHEADHHARPQREARHPLHAAAARTTPTPPPPEPEPEPSPQPSRQPSPRAGKQRPSSAELKERAPASPASAAQPISSCAISHDLPRSAPISHYPGASGFGFSCPPERPPVPDVEAPPCDSSEGGILGDLEAVRLHARMIC